MSCTIHVITNSLDGGDWIVVYETCSGSTVYEGHSINAYNLFQILDSVNGMCEKIKYHELTDEQIQDWREHI